MNFIRKILSFHLKASAVDHSLIKKYALHIYYIPGTLWVTKTAQKYDSYYIVIINPRDKMYQKSPKMVKVSYKINCS